MDRVETWPQIVNFRDAGGYRSAFGGRVKKGLIFRGVALSHASDSDLAALAALGVGLVFDLRGKQEADGRPDRLPVGAVYRREAAVPAFDEDPLEMLSWDDLIDQLAETPELAAKSRAFHDQVYGEMIRRPQAFGALLGEMVADPGRGVYIHCAAGKDRTGVACAIIARLLGVCREDAMADYMESGRNPMPDSAGVRELARRKGVGDLIDIMLGTTSWQFDQAWEEPDRAWGGWDGFLRDGLGLSPGDVAGLRAAYLED